MASVGKVEVVKWVCERATASNVTFDKALMMESAATGLNLSVIQYYHDQVFKLPEIGSRRSQLTRSFLAIPLGCKYILLCCHEHCSSRGWCI